jgi:Uma2 family endonuclease
MTTTLHPSPPVHRRAHPADRTLADLVKRLGVAPNRILLDPPPGTATEKDLLRAESKHGRLCEMVEWTLVEKTVGIHESILAGYLIAILQPFVRKHHLGFVTSPDGMMRLFSGTVRAPDVAFISWDRFPGRKLPSKPIPIVAPDLAIEVLSRSNRKTEMSRKRQEYFGAGTRLVWQVDPIKRIVQVFHQPDDPVTLRESDTLTGNQVLPGFKLALRELFAELDATG